MRVKCKNAVTRMEKGERVTYRAGDEITCGDEEGKSLIDSAAAVGVEGKAEAPKPRRGRKPKVVAPEPQEEPGEDDTPDGWDA